MSKTKRDMQMMNDIGSRRKRFFLYCLVALLVFGPAMKALAAVVDLGTGIEEPATPSGTANTDDVISWSLRWSGNVKVTYVSTDGVETVAPATGYYKEDGTTSLASDVDDGILSRNGGDVTTYDLSEIPHTDVQKWNISSSWKPDLSLGGTYLAIKLTPIIPPCTVKMKEEAAHGTVTIDGTTLTTASGVSVAKGTAKTIEVMPASGYKLTKLTVTPYTDAGGAGAPRRALSFGDAQEVTMTWDGNTGKYTATVNVTSNLAVTTTWTSHTHFWSYTAAANVITATCSGEGTCPLTDQTLTLSAADATYDGASHGATYAKSTNWPGESSYTITYYKNSVSDANKLTGAPTLAGSYIATVSQSTMFDTPATAQKSFTIAPKNCTVSFVANGGTGTMTNVSVGYGGTAGNYTIPACGFTYGGHTFTNWTSGSNTYAPDDVITVSDNITLTAQWTADTYAITAPTGQSLTYDATDQELVAAGSVETGKGTMYYRLGTDGTWGTTIPTATAAGTYQVYYYVKGDNGYVNTGSTDSPISHVTTTIAKREVTLTWTPSTTQYVYDGTGHQSTCTLGNVVSGDVCNVSVSYSGDGKEVDSYTATATGLTGAQSGNYILPDDCTYSYEVVLQLTAYEDKNNPGTYFCTYYDEVRNLMVSDAFSETPNQKVWVVTKINDGTVVTEQIIDGTIKAGTPVLLSSNSSTITLKKATGAVTTPTTNLLKGTAAPLTVKLSDNAYVLTSNGFLLAEGTIPAAKAYLQIANAASAPRMLIIAFGGEATGIGNIEHSTLNIEHSDAVYTLQGIRIAPQQMQSGQLYIINGKKVKR